MLTIIAGDTHLGFFDKCFVLPSFIMPKEISKATKSRYNAYFRSLKEGKIMPVKCSRCVSKGLECRVLPGSERCGECVKSIGRDTCDVYGVSRSQWLSIEREEARLEAAEEAAVQEEEAFALAEQEAYTKRQEALARRMRLRKQQKVLKEKAGKMLQHDLHTIEALEEFEEKERLEKERAEQAEQASQASTSVAVDLSSFELPPMSDSEMAAWWAAEGSFDGISPSQLGSSSS
jgi:hypothetical protein